MGLQFGGGLDGRRSAKAMVNLTVTFDGLDDILNRLDPARVQDTVRAVVTGTARLLLRYSQMDAPVATGTLRRAGFMQVESDGQSAIVAYGISYAGVMESGSIAHDIYARNAKTLAFIPSSFGSLADAQASLTAQRKSGAVSKSGAKGDLVIFPTHVYHPGTLANPFLQRGWEDAGPEAGALVSDIGQKWMGGEDQVEQ
jgi:hypothetical protein